MAAMYQIVPSRQRSRRPNAWQTMFGETHGDNIRIVILDRVLLRHGPSREDLIRGWMQEPLYGNPTGILKCIHGLHLNMMLRELFDHAGATHHGDQTFHVSGNCGFTTGYIATGAVGDQPTNAHSVETHLVGGVNRRVLVSPSTCSLSVTCVVRGDVLVVFSMYPIWDFANTISRTRFQRIRSDDQAPWSSSHIRQWRISLEEPPHSALHEYDGYSLDSSRNYRGAQPHVCPCVTRGQV